MHKIVRILFSRDASAVLNYIHKKSITSKSERIMYDSIQRKIELIKNNPSIGQPINKKLIPKEYLADGYDNVYRLELSRFWRILYTLRDNKIEIIAFVLDVLDHKQYNKKFKYK